MATKTESLLLEKMNVCKALERWKSCKSIDKALKRTHKTLQKNSGPLLMLCDSELLRRYSVWLTWWLEEAPLPFVLPLPPTAEALLRRACSWSNSKSSRRWVKASFCWMAIRNSEFRVFFSSSAAASCLCMSSSWVTYSSHLRERARGEKWTKEQERKEKMLQGRQ